MIAGTLGFLSQTVDGPLENHYESGYRGVDLDTSLQYLDNHRVQQGVVAGRVTQQSEHVHVGSGHIDVETDKREEIVASEFLADVEEGGWILSERTWTTDEEHLPDWPFSLFSTRLGVEIEPMGLDVSQFVKNQQDAGRDLSVEMATQEGAHSDNVEIQWGKRVSQQEAIQSNVGTALTVNWNGTFVRLVVYDSGYIAVWEPGDLSPVIGRFVHEEIVPVAVPLGDVEEDSEQQEVTA